MKSRLFLKIGLILLLGGALFFLYYFFNPASGQSLFPTCPSKMFFGIYCPGCGSQRAIHYLLHCDIAAAWRYNPMLIIILPLAIVLIIQFLFRHLMNYYWRIKLFENNTFLYVLFFLFILYMLGRNIYLPAFDGWRPPSSHSN